MTTRAQDPQGRDGAGTGGPAVGRYLPNQLAATSAAITTPATQARAVPSSAGRSAVYRAAAGPDRQEVPRALAEATEPVATANPGLVAETCKLCDILINRFYWDAHNRGHRWADRPSSPPRAAPTFVPPGGKGDAMFTLRSILRPTRIVYAHCDIPCGIYDAEQARIEAESCYKIIGMYEASDDALFKPKLRLPR